MLSVVGVAWQLVVDRLRTIATAGLTYSKDPYDQARYSDLIDVLGDILTGVIGPLPTDAAVYLKDEGYVTPKVDVRAVVFDQNRVLLVQEAADRRWALPGGWADLGCSPAEVAVREVEEEAGLAVQPVALLALLHKAQHHSDLSLSTTYKVFFRCELTEGSTPHLAGTPHEILEIGWFDRDTLPDLSLGRVTPEQIRRMFEYLDDPTLPTDYDPPRRGSSIP